MLNSRFILTLSVMLMAEGLCAQVAEVGVKGGPAFTSLVSAASKHRPLLSMVAGVYAPIPINPRLIFQPELEIATMGTARYSGAERTDALRTTYLRAPLTLRLKVAPRIQVGVGLQPGYLLFAWRQDHDTTMVATGDIKSFDMSFICGASVCIAAHTDVTLRYVYGLTSVLANDRVYFPTNRAIQLTLGLRMKRFKGASVYRRRSFAR